jgi:GlpG protein
MREIGKLPDEQQAIRFRDYALTQGVEVMVEADGHDGWSVWVYEEDLIDRAREQLAQFREDPQNERYVAAARSAEDLRKAAQRREEQVRKRQVDIRSRWNRPMWAQFPVTMGLIAASIFVAVATRAGDQHGPVLKALSITSYPLEGTAASYRLGLPEVRQGQVWRLVTPVFIHFGFLHILFNMLWLRNLGASVELYNGSLKYAVMILAMSIPSNVAQYMLSGPYFGGMSGVVFGLFGYIWMKSRFEPESGFFMHPNTVFLMVAWFLICMTGAVGAIANAAHAGGLAVGVLLGIAPTLRRRLKQR